MKVFSCIMAVAFILSTGLAGMVYVLTESVLFLGRVMMDLGNLIF